LEQSQLLGNRVSHKRWRFAQQREREYQQRKALAAAGREQVILDHATANARQVSAFLGELGYLVSEGLVVEVGSGAHGLIWKWPAKRRIAIDPLAVFYRSAFTYLQQDDVTVLAASGGQLPLEDAVADVLLSDNVLYDVQDPSAYLQECARVLKPSGILYFTVDVHHSVYWWAGAAYNALFRLGVRARVPAFPNHPFHFTESRVLHLLDACGFQTVSRRGGYPHRPGTADHPLGGTVKRTIRRLFLKNARVEIVARTPPP
jgi:SAM-dependent methyltransferase